MDRVPMPSPVDEFPQLAPYRSLSQHEHYARAAMVDHRFCVGAASPEHRASVLYQQAYMDYFGQRAFVSEDRSKFLQQASELCQREGIELALYIDAQMYGLRKALAKSGMQFMPTMLSGDMAAARYNLRVKQFRRLYRRADLQVLFLWTRQCQVLQRLCVDELDVAESFIAKGKYDTVSWVRQAMQCDMPVWQLVESKGGEHAKGRKDYAVLENRYGAESLCLMKRVAQLSVACGIAAGYRAGLEDRIGWSGDTTFNWPEFAKVLSGMFGTPERKKVNISGMDVIQKY